ncbi:integrase core domain-containing protein [Microbacterium sp. NPDC091382]|uniref:integrase core domain-containing protein n=1 Tax=Microbacterium sp. NPDC091382 TaxID=3364210 RepID=UPI003821BF23
MGRVASSVDNGLMESFWSTMQPELLDQPAWQSPDELARAIFEWIEVWYNPKRRHSGIGDVSPLEFENTHPAAIATYTLLRGAADAGLAPAGAAGFLGNLPSWNGE